MSYCDNRGIETSEPPPLRYPDRKRGPGKGAPIYGRRTTRRPSRAYLIGSAVFVAIAIAAAVWAPRAFAQPRHPCGPRAKVIKQLADKYGETQRTMGLKQQGVVVSVYETWANDETGTWTILLSKPDGTACLIASGSDWLDDAGPLGPQGDDA